MLEKLLIGSLIDHEEVKEFLKVIESNLKKGKDYKYVLNSKRFAKVEPKLKALLDEEKSDLLLLRLANLMSIDVDTSIQAYTCFGILLKENGGQVSFDFVLQSNTEQFNGIYDYLKGKIHTPINNLKSQKKTTDTKKKTKKAKVQKKDYPLLGEIIDNLSKPDDIKDNKSTPVKETESTLSNFSSDILTKAKTLHNKAKEENKLNSILEDDNTYFGFAKYKPEPTLEKLTIEEPRIEEPRIEMECTQSKPKVEEGTLEVDSLEFTKTSYLFYDPSITAFRENVSKCISMVLNKYDYDKTMTFIKSEIDDVDKLCNTKFVELKLSDGFDVDKIDFFMSEYETDMKGDLISEVKSEVLFTTSAFKDGEVKFVNYNGTYKKSIKRLPSFVPNNVYIVRKCYTSDIYEYTVVLVTQ